MAPKNGVKGGIAAYRAGIKSQAAILRQTRLGNFRTVSDSVNAIYGNLGSTLAGNSRNLTGEQSRQLAALRRLRSNTSSRLGGMAAGAGKQVASRYGSAIAGAEAPALKSLGVTAKAGTKAVNAQVGAAGILARGNEQALGTLQAGASAAQAGAQALTADALAYRAHNDAALIASEKLDLQKMVLQNKLDIQNYKAKLALEDKSKLGNTSASAIAETATSAVPSMLTFFRENSDRVDADGNAAPPTAAEAAQAWAAANGVTDPTDPEYKVVLSVARAMANAGAGVAGSEFGADRLGTVTAGINNAISILYPNLTSKQSDAVSGIISSTATGWALNSAYTTDPAANYAGDIFNPLALLAAKGVK